jgi:catechol 2,3-dioxygenase-like lactoylglutathione lyase family enzyme/predicted enzyme related to lactoylglutathione lyase
MRYAIRLALLALCGNAVAAPRPPITSVSHLAVYDADLVKAEHFYVHDLGAVKAADPEDPAGTRYYFSPTQFVEVLPLPANAGLNRADHIAFNTADAEAMRQYLVSKKVTVPRALTKGTDGSAWFSIKDPEGITVQFVQAKPAAVATNPLFPHIIHVGAIVKDRAMEDGFYRDILGFRPYWSGAMKDDAPPQWVSQQVADGSDWLEYMLTTNTLSQAQMGVLNHFALGVPNMENVYTKLWNDDRLQGQPASATPKIGRDAKWQLNLLDPDGTRAEVMELHAIGKPCCSPFTASDPAQ